MFRERFEDFPEHPFAQLRALLNGIEPGGAEVAMCLGEPRSPLPQSVGQSIHGAMAEFSKYPVNQGYPELLTAIQQWLERRYGIIRDPATEILALNGTREGLFNTAMALGTSLKAGHRAVVLHPNPGYQVYGVAGLAIGAQTVGVSATRQNGYLPDYCALDPAVLERTTIAYLTSPSNPQGAVAGKNYWRKLFELADKYDFWIFADECYSDIWRDSPPPGALEVAAEQSRWQARLVAFHSLSKRSGVPGLRSGFAVAPEHAMQLMKRLRAYAGSPLPGPIQKASAMLWSDEAHVAQNRSAYQRKYALADNAFKYFKNYQPVDAGMLLWLPVTDGEMAAKTLWTKAGIRTLPGAYLATPDTQGVNPGGGYLRVALVLPDDILGPALQKMAQLLEHFQA
jgi:N-succinyldiaminopimelate aminotransferase